MPFLLVACGCYAFSNVECGGSRIKPGTLLVIEPQMSNILPLGRCTVSHIFLSPCQVGDMQWQKSCSKRYWLITKVSACGGRIIKALLQLWLSLLSTAKIKVHTRMYHSLRLAIV